MRETIRKYRDLYFKKKEIKNEIFQMKKSLKNRVRKSNKGLIKYIDKPGIALTFDDGFRVQQWYNYGFGHKEGYKNIFQVNDVRATFNINALHPFENYRELNQVEIDMLLDIQACGHELAHHGYAHKNAVEYVDKFGVDSWVKHEVKELFSWRDKHKHSFTGEGFKKSAAFVYPGSKYSEKTNNAISPKFFPICRAYLEEDNLVPMEYSGLCPSVCIDENLFPFITQIKGMMKITKKSGLNLVLMCHSILPSEAQWSDFGWGEEAEEDGRYRISPKSLNYVIKQAKKLDLEFYTLSEIAGIAIFKDSNLERYVRELISKPEASNQWIYIKDLLDIKELDISNRHIKDLSGLEYFVNLEKLNVTSNEINDIEKMKELKNLKYVEMKNNIIGRETVEQFAVRNNSEIRFVI